MNNYSSLRKKNNGTFFAVVALALCVVVSTAALFSRLSAYSPAENTRLIPLTESNGLTHVTVEQPSMQSAKVVSLAAKNLANETEEVTETTWLGMTELEVFSLSYENGAGQITVDSASGDNVVAPGTSNEFKFSLYNSGDSGLDYTMTVNAYITVDEVAELVPVELKMMSYTGEYLIGSKDAFTQFGQIGTVTDSGSLTAGYVMPYTIEWQWPFEGDDALDTSLGNYFKDHGEDITLVLEINTVAQLGGDGGMPQTGDNGIAGAAAVMVASLAGLLIVLLIPWRRREAENA